MVYFWEEPALAIHLSWRAFLLNVSQNEVKVCNTIQYKSNTMQFSCIVQIKSKLVTKSTDYVIASTRSTFVNSPVSFHEPCLPTGASPGSSRQEFQKEKHSSRTEATAKTLVLKKTTGIRNTGPMELRKSPPRNRQQTPRQTTNYDKTNNRYNRTRSHRSTHQISAQQKVTTKAKQANFKTTTRTAQSEEV